MDEPLPTVVERLVWRAAHQADRWAFAFLCDGEREQARITYGELDRRARAIAAALRADAAPGDRALLLYPPGIEFIAGLFGCLYAGVLAVPAYPPDPARLARSLERLAAITHDAAPALVLGTRSLLDLLAPLRGSDARLATARWLATDELVAAPAVRAEPAQQTIAFLQYTSGSTSMPKGVVVSHANVAANAALFSRSYAMTEDSVVVSWLPLYHDMGLVGCVLAGVYTGYPSVLMSPVDFLRKPARWLRAMTAYRATTSVAPDFGYALCARRVREDDRAELDLRAWRTAISGAEPVRAETLTAFAAAFAPAGFDERAFAPSYGLAESTLYVTGSSAERRAPVRLAVDAAALANGRAVDAAPGAKTRMLIGCGGVGDADRVAIADPVTRTRCADGRIGEIWVAGDSVALGYWHRDDDTRAAFGARLAGDSGAPRFYLRTGDLGFVLAGELFVTGRAKDVLVIRGKCHYPQDIERTAERAHPILRAGACAAFALEHDGEEQVGLAIEVARDVEPAPAWHSVRAAIRDAVAEHHELRVAAISLLPPAGVPKTSSGKIQRRACREAFLRGELCSVDGESHA